MKAWVDGLGCRPSKMSSYNGRRNFRSRTGTSTSRLLASSKLTQSRDTIASPNPAATARLMAILQPGSVFRQRPIHHLAGAAARLAHDVRLRA